MGQFIGSVLLVVSAGIAAAAPPAATDPMEICWQMADDNARHACFDQEMQRRHAAGAQAPVADSKRVDASQPSPATPSNPVASRATDAASGLATRSDENFGLEGEQLRHKQRAQGVAKAKSPPQVLTAQIARAQARPDHRFTFVLDNGQTWEQTETRGGFFLDSHEQVAITPGVLGSFILETSKQEFVRVRRLN
jgi:hypothetical protein